MDSRNFSEYDGEIAEGADEMTQPLQARMVWSRPTFMLRALPAILIGGPATRTQFRESGRDDTLC